MNSEFKNIMFNFSDFNAEAEFIPLLSSEDEEQMDSEKIPDNLPILPLRNTVLFPGVVIPITVGREKSIKLKDPPNNTLKITAYRNTSFVNFVVKKKLYEALEKKAEELETNIEYLVYNAIRLILNGSVGE